MYGLTWEYEGNTFHRGCATFEAATHRMFVLLEDGVKQVHITRNGYKEN